MSNSRIIFFSLILFSFGCNVGQNKSEAQALASQIHNQIQAGDYKGLYNAAEPNFQKGGTEAEFVTAMEQLRQEYGTLKKASPVAYATRIDSNIGTMHILIYDLEFDRKKVTERITFTRSDQGKMQLYEMNFNPIN